MAMSRAYFATDDGKFFRPTEWCRGPWDANACHGGPPLGLAVRAIEALVADQRLVRVGADLVRPIPLAGFSVRTEVRRRGRSMTLATVELHDEDTIFMTVNTMSLRTLDPLDCATSAFSAPRFEDSVPGPFPIHTTLHGLPCFPESVEVRYDPAGSIGQGGPTTIWMRALPLLADEEPSGFQNICALADCGNGVSFNDYLDRVLFVNPDIQLSIHRTPVGEWFAAKVVSHWQGDGIGMSDAELFDCQGPVGRVVQNILLHPVGG